MTITSQTVPPSSHDAAGALRVAMLAPIAWRTPPVHYGPWEQIASTLAEGLVARGVDVTLFATGDSLTAGRLEWVASHGYAEDPAMDGRVWEALHVAHAVESSGEFDLVHSHLDWLPLTLERMWAAPLITTVHGFSGPAILPAYERADSALVSISDADRAPNLDYAATIHHGIDLDAFPQGPGGEDLLVFSRIHPDKGILDAIEIAARAGRRLILAGIVQDEEYFRDSVLPRIDDDRVIYVGSIDATGRAAVLGSAAAMLHPVHFDEPFGLSVVEAMACGTPVIAYRRGSMPEVVDEGVTGFLVDGIPTAANAVAEAVALDRGRVRSRACERFGADRMVDSYLDLYAAVLAAAPAPRRNTPRRAQRKEASR